MPQIIPYSQQAAASDERMRSGLTNALNASGNSLASHLAEKSLRQALSGTNFDNKSPEEKALQLQQATAPYGESGQRLLQPYLEQLQAQKQQANQGILGKALRGQPLTPQEESQLGAREQLEIAKIRSKENIEENRNRNRAPAGGLSGQSVPPQIAQAIPQILNANKDANADELAMAFDNAGIPRAYSNSYVQSRRDSTKPTFEPESEKLEAKRVADLATEVEKNYTTARNEDIRLDRMLQLSDKGDVSTPAMMKVLDTIGLPIGILSNPDTE